MQDSKISTKTKITSVWKSKFIPYKIYIQRFLTYSAMINFVMLFFLVMSKLAEMGLKVSKIGYALAIIGMIGLAVFIGFLDIKLGFFKSEIDFNQRNNPVAMETLERIKRIEEKLK